MPPAKHREPIVPAKVKAAVEFLFTTPNADLHSAAQHAGITTYKLRSSMMQPHVLRWLLTEKQARLEAASAGNIGALLEVRDKADNSMARVAAAKSLEQMLDTVSVQTGTNRSPSQRQAPGVVIVIQGADGRVHQQLPAGPPPAPMIDMTPERSAELSE
jgi:hypothetical protein